MGKEEWKGGESFYDQFDKYERILRSSVLSIQ